MKKIIIFVIASLALQSCASSGSNSKINLAARNFFPGLSGTDLQGDNRILPKDFSNKLNIVAIAFEREQQKEVDAWAKVANNFARENRNATFFEIPLIEQRGYFSRYFINNGMRKGIKENDKRKSTITVYTDRAQFLKIMNMKASKVYVLLIDNKGKILWRIEGPFNKDRERVFKEALQRNYRK